MSQSTPLSAPDAASRIIVALDFPDRAQTLALLDRLEPGSCRVKIGKELFTRCGPELVAEVRARGFDVFLDLKYHDIPNTVAAACRAAADLGVWMVNVHASGGRRMMVAAREALDSASQPPLLIAVTILTSMAVEDMAEVGFQGEPQANVQRLAALAADAGLDGVVCSPREASALRTALGQDFLLVTPGVRPGGAASDDQRRTLTPAEAIRAGSSYLVVGRPITAAEDPLASLAAIQAEVNQVQAG